MTLLLAEPPSVENENQEQIDTTLPVRVHSVPHPFRSAQYDHYIDAAEQMTVAEMLEHVQTDDILRRHAHVFVGGEYVPRSYWHRVRPKAGSIVNIRVLPGGGSTLRTILQIAVIAASLFIPGAIGLSGFAAAAASAGILVGGQLLINAIAPIQPPEQITNPAESPSYFIDSARNAARPYQPVPIILGKHKVVPSLGALPYTESLGSTNRLRMVFVWGFGPLAITDIKIDETPLTDYSDYEVETLQGYENDPDQTLYPSDVDQQNLAIRLTHEGGWQTRTSAAEADFLSVDITMPQGIALFSSKGERQEHEVTVQVQYRRVGTQGWQAPTLSPDAPEGIAIAGSRVILRDSVTRAIRHGVRWPTPSRGQYQVRVRRITSDPDEEESTSTYDETHWTALRTFTSEPPIDLPWPVALTALNIRASDQFNRSIDRLSGICTSIVKDWDGSAWVEQESSNPASLFRYVLQHPSRWDPAPDSDIDLEDLQEWHDFCVSNGYEFNAVLDGQASLREVLDQIAAAGRASVTRIDGLWTVIVDTGSQTPDQYFTPRNSRNFVLTKEFADVPHALRIGFNNREREWRRDERIVYADNYDDTNATLYESIGARGITDPSHIYKLGRFHLAQLILRPERWQFETDFEYLTSQRGSRALVTHDVLVVGLGSGRIKELIRDDSDAITDIVIDNPIIFENNVAHACAVRSVSNPNLVLAIQNRGPGDSPISQLTLSTPLSTGTLPAIGDLISVGESGRVGIDGLITNIEGRDDLSASVTMVPWSSPDVYQAHLGTIPAFDSKISSAAAGTYPFVIRGVRDDYIWYRERDTRRVQVIVVEIDPPPETGFVAEAQIRPSGGGEYRAANIVSQSVDQVVIGDLYQAKVYDLRLRWIHPDGRTGGWTYRTNFSLTADPYGDILGADGNDGNGVEYVFASTATASLPASKRPKNSWGFDNPGIADDLQWFDGASGVTETTPYMWRAERRVPGVPERDADVAELWSEPVIVGRQGLNGLAGVAGADGSDGNGVEYVFTVTSTASIPASKRPQNSWGYDSPGTADEQLWTDGASDVTASNPYLWSSQRTVPGAPAVGDAVADLWSEPVIVGRFGPAGAQGLTGVAGADGSDGNGIEYVFTVTSAASIPTSKRPQNSWGYDSPGTADGQLWTDGASNVTATNPYLWRARRTVPGAPAVGDAVADLWSEPVIVGRYGPDGTPGTPGIPGVPGIAGDDGAGVEYIFANTSTTSVPSNQRPLNSWGFDQPGTRNGLTWTDSGADTTADTPYMWRSQRAIEGTPSTGDSVADTWTAPVLISRYGEQGVAGTDGADGNGIEYIFTLTADSTAPAAPLNSWGYDEPGTVDGQEWTDGASNLTADLPYLWRAERTVPGAPAAGDTVADLWTTAVIVGVRGAAGDPASRGPGQFRVEVSAAQQTILEAITGDTLTNPDLIALANGATPGDNLLADSVIFWRGGTFASAWAWDGTNWRSLQPYIGAQLILAETIGAQHIQAGSITANKITGDVRNARVLYSRSISALSTSDIIRSSERSVTLADTWSSYDSLQIVCLIHASNGHSRVASVTINTIDIQSSYNAYNTLAPHSTYDNVWFTTVGGTSGDDDFLFRVWGSSGTTTLNIRSRTNDNEGYLLTIVGLKNPVDTAPISGPPGGGGGTPPPSQAPGTPSTPTVVTRTSTSITVSTTAGTGGAPSLYRWRYSTNSTISGSDPEITSSGAQVTITGLSADTNYWIDVRAENSDGNSDYSGDLATSTTTTPTQVPGTPSTPTSSSPSTTSLTFSTTAGSGGTPTAYRWRYRQSGTTSWSSAGTTSSNSIILTGLTSGTTYQVQVRAENSAGNSSYSSSGTGTTTTSGSDNTLATANDLGDLTSTSSTTRTGSISSSADSPDYYKFVLTATRSVTITLSGLSADLDLELDDSTGSEIEDSTYGGTTSETITESLAAGTYYVRIYQFSSNTSDYTLAINVSTPNQDLMPSLPSSVSPDDATVGTAYSYQLPAATGGNTPLAYSLSGARSWISFNSTTRTITGTPAADDVGSDSMTLTVTDSDGDTDTVTFTLQVNSAPPDPPDPPSLVAPTNLTATYDATNDWIRLDWDAVTNATHYQHRWREEGTSAWGTWQTQIGTNTLEFIDTGLTAGKTYEFQVRARDASNNASGASNTATATYGTGTTSETITITDSSITKLDASGLGMYAFLSGNAVVVPSSFGSGVINGFYVYGSGEIDFISSSASLNTGVTMTIKWTDSGGTTLTITGVTSFAQHSPSNSSSVTSFFNQLTNGESSTLDITFNSS